MPTLRVIPGADATSGSWIGAMKRGRVALQAHRGRRRALRRVIAWLAIFVLAASDLLPALDDGASALLGTPAAAGAVVTADDGSVPADDEPVIRPQRGGRNSVAREDVDRAKPGRPALLLADHVGLGPPPSTIRGSWPPAPARPPSPPDTSFDPRGPPSDLG
jgi:hypothetical protein